MEPERISAYAPPVILAIAAIDRTENKHTMNTDLKVFQAYRIGISLRRKLMARLTQIQLWSKERDDYGFPKKHNVYQLGATLRIGDTYSSPVLRVRDSDYRISSLPNRIKANTEEEARSKAVDHFRQEASKLGLDFFVVELPDA